MKMIHCVLDISYQLWKAGMVSQRSKDVAFEKQCVYKLGIILESVGKDGVDNLKH